MKILLVPSLVKGNGTGHFIRCLRLAQSLKGKAALCLSNSGSVAKQIWNVAELTLAFGVELANIPILTRSEALRNKPWELIILDNRYSSKGDLLLWELMGPVIALDENGPAREEVSFLVDILPLPKKEWITDPKIGTNISRIAFLDLPTKRRQPPHAIEKVIITFGGADEAEMSLPIARLLLANSLVHPGQLTIVLGALHCKKITTQKLPTFNGVSFISAVQNLKEHLHQYDLVITQFGLTAFEAAWAGCAVALLSSSSYHQKLCRDSGFIDLGLGKATLSLLKKIFANPRSAIPLVNQNKSKCMLPKSLESLPDFIQNLRVSGPIHCPLCGSYRRKAIARFEKKSYFRCSGCKLMYMTRFDTQGPVFYDETYFFNAYRSQYGRSYLDDWQSISTLANNRLNVLQELSYILQEPLKIIDIGCAYGVFLDAARKRGYLVFGVDLAASPVQYMNEQLKIRAVQGDFEDKECTKLLPGKIGFTPNVLSLWYAIEHFTNLDTVLKTAASLLAEGGILALSTPSGQGISCCKSRRQFLMQSPDDHFSIWEPSLTSKILSRYGFKLLRIRSIGHHPERFPLFQFLRDTSKNKFLQILYAIIKKISQIFALGDSYEIYASFNPTLAKKSVSTTESETISKFLIDELYGKPFSSSNGE